MKNGACIAYASDNINVFFVFMRSATDKRVSFEITVLDLSKIKRVATQPCATPFAFIMQ